MVRIECSRVEKLLSDLKVLSTVYCQFAES